MKILFNIFVVLVIVATIIFLYQKYAADFSATSDAPGALYTVFVDGVVLSVSLADTDEERIKGLSGTDMLPETGGKLFVFDTEARHGIWMKDMKFSIDIMWFNDELELIYIEENVSPSTYPAVFAPSQDARFVLETNANLVEALRIQLGDVLSLPATILPDDIRRNLQE